jgi:hypothetical protein
VIVAGVSQKLPAGHGVSDVDEAGQKDPLEHVEIVDGVLQKLPAGHGDAEMDPGSQ